MNDFNKRMEEESRKKFGDRPVVFGDGRLNAEIMLIGEAPGAEQRTQTDQDHHHPPRQQLRLLQ